MAEKLYAGSTGRPIETLQWTKYAFLRIIYSLSIFSLYVTSEPRGMMPHVCTV